MASLVNPSNINGNFPIAGQDNDSQGFRDNFTNIRNNFTFIKQEVEDLQAKAVLKTALSGASLDNNFLGSQLKNPQLKNYSETLYDWGRTSGEIGLDLALGNVHKVYTEGSVKINSVIKNWPATLQYSRILVYITVSSVSHTLELPNNITTDLSSIPGLRNRNGNYIISFTDAGDYVFEFASTDSGTTVFVKELTRGNHIFRDPNFYMAGIGAGLPGSGHVTGYESPSLRLGWGNLIGISSKIDTLKSGIDAFSVNGAVTSYLNFASGDINSANLRSAGFTVARSRTADPGTGDLTETAAQAIVSGDLIGYYNGIALNTNAGGGATYQQMGSVQFYASGEEVSNGLGGNVVIATKRDGVTGLVPAMIVDNKQSVTIFGNLTVEGVTTTVNSTQVEIADRQITLAFGAASTVQANSAGISVASAFANLEYHALDTTIGGGDRWAMNKALSISPTTPSTSSVTGALVVAGGAGISGDLNVGGVFGLTSTTESIAPSTGAFVIGGGVGINKNLNVQGNIAANAVTETTGLLTGALQSHGGLSVSLSAIIGGNLSVTGELEAVSTTNASVRFTGGVGIAKKLIANGAVILGNTVNSTYTMGATGTNYSGALRVHGGAHIAQTLNVGNDAGAGRIVINVPVAETNLIGVLGDTSTGALIVGTAGHLGGISATGNFNLGNNERGTMYILNRSTSQGTSIDGTLTPYTVRAGGEGAMTVLGGANVFGNLFVGQPYDGATGNTLGNIYVQSGTPATSFNTGSIVLANVKLNSGSYSQGGMGIAGNLWVQGNVFLGSLNNNVSNVVVTAITETVNSTTGALVVRGGVGIAANTQIAGNVVISSAIGGDKGSGATSRAGALVIPTGGAYIGGVSYFGSNLVSTSETVGSGAGGSIYTSGGIGIAKNLWVSDTAEATVTAGSGAIYTEGGIKAARQSWFNANVVSQGNVLVQSATGAIGYSVGSGGTATQAVTLGKATAVTVNDPTGLITMAANALASGTSIAFTLTSSAITANDMLIINHESAGTLGGYGFATVCSSGSAVITVRNNTAGSLSEAPVLRYMVLRSANT